MYRLLSGVFMGWAHGSNNAANVFGTAVFSKTVRYRTAVILCALFVIIGAVAEGQAGMNTISGLVNQTATSAFVASLAAAVTVTLMSVLKMPVSTSQAIVGAIIGIGLSLGKTDFSGLTKVVICWVGTPIGAVAVSMILYPVLGRILDSLPVNIFTRDRLIKVGLIAAGSYGAYALGANNVANITGVYAQTGMLSDFQAVLLGGGSIALGVLTYSKNVMMTVGRKLVKLDPYSALITVLSEAMVVHFFAKVGVPVSTSQAIVGAVLGIGLLKGVKTINNKTLVSILFGWLGTPAVALLVSFLAYRLLVV
jgi:PiT family inorganic phosphate transporter